MPKHWEYNKTLDREALYKVELNMPYEADSHTPEQMFNSLKEEYNGDKEKIEEYIDKQLEMAKDVYDSRGMFTMSNYWREVKRHI